MQVCPIKFSHSILTQILNLELYGSFVANYALVQLQHCYVNVNLYATHEIEFPNLLIFLLLLVHLYNMYVFQEWREIIKTFLHVYAIYIPCSILCLPNTHFLFHDLYCSPSTWNNCFPSSVQKAQELMISPTILQVSLVTLLSTPTSSPKQSSWKFL